MTDPTCCSAAHNIEIVRRELDDALKELRTLRERVKELEAFKRLAYRLAGEQLDKP